MSEFGKQLELHHKTLVEEIAELRQLQGKLESVLGLMKVEGVAPPTAQRHFIEAAHDLLLEKGRLHYLDLARALREAGVFIPGMKPEANLLAHMSRDERFTKVDRGVYEVGGNGTRKGNGKPGKPSGKKRKS
jgi:hypothetical protein